MGSGFALDMISRLKQNQSLRVKTDFSTLKKAYLNNASKQGIDYKKATKRELFLIRQKIITQKRKEGQQQIWIYCITVVITVIMIVSSILLIRISFF